MYVKLYAQISCYVFTIAHAFNNTPDALADGIYVEKYGVLYQLDAIKCKLVHTISNYFSTL